jgi:predicted N-acetyltransferase YhbS
VSLSVRPETGGDADAIRAVHLQAFPAAAEADLVARLREDRDSRISLIADPAAGAAAYAPAFGAAGGPE